MRILLLVSLTAFPLFVHAQSNSALVVPSCGSASYSAGQSKAVTQDPTGNACVSTVGSSSGGSTVVQGPGTAGTPSGGVLSIQGVAGGTPQPISAASLPLPSGAATVAAQTNVQSAAGTPDATVLNVQGNASGVALPVAQSGTWTVQPGNTANTTAWLFKIDQTTPGTTNGVVVNSSALPTGAATAANQTATQGSKAPGTAATSADLGGGVYNSAGVTLTDGQQAALQLGVNGGLLVGGVIASGSADTGNPVKIGGKFNTTAPTFTDGQRGDIQLDNKGSLRVAIAGSNGVSLNTTAQGDSINNANTGLVTVPLNSIFNGTTWDRARSVVNATNTIGTGIAAVGVLAQVDDTSPTAITENQFGNVRMSADRSLLTSVQNSFSHISTATTTTVKSGAGTLHSITINALGTVASSTTVYDNTAGSGTVIAVINSLTISGTLTYDAQFSTGLTLVTTGTVAPDVTVSYK